MNKTAIDSCNLRECLAYAYNRSAAVRAHGLMLRKYGDIAIKYRIDGKQLGKGIMSSVRRVHYQRHAVLFTHRVDGFKIGCIAQVIGRGNEYAARSAVEPLAQTVDITPVNLCIIKRRGMPKGLVHVADTYYSARPSYAQQRYMYAACRALGEYESVRRAVRLGGKSLRLGNRPDGRQQIIQSIKFGKVVLSACKKRRVLSHTAVSRHMEAYRNHRIV